MKMLDALSALFAKPRGFSNLLLASICLLIPLVGLWVVIGYLCEVFDSRTLFLPVASPSSSTTQPTGQPYPDFDFNRFSIYLVRGTWPFFVFLIAACPITFVGVMTAALLSVLLAVHVPAFVAFFMYVIAIAVAAVISAVIAEALVPLQLRSVINSDFKTAFDFSWMKDFFTRVGRQLLIELVIFVFLGLFLETAGVAMCIVGVFPATVLVAFTFTWIVADLYRLYIQRGGAPVARTTSLA